MTARCVGDGVATRRRLITCAGSAPGFDGSALASGGEVVVVTVNHRLNLFGYLSLDDSDERFADAATRVRWTWSRRCAGCVTTRPHSAATRIT